MNISQHIFKDTKGVKMRKRGRKPFSSLFAAALLAAGIALGGGAAAPSQVQKLVQETGIVLTVEAKETTDYQASADLNIRSKASTKAKVLGTLSKGDAVKVYSIDGDWAKISYDGGTAYVAAKYLAEMGTISVAKTSSSSSSGSSGGGSGSSSGGGSSDIMVWLTAMRQDKPEQSLSGDKVSGRSARVWTLQQVLVGGAGRSSPSQKWTGSGVPTDTQAQ